MSFSPLVGVGTLVFVVVNFLKYVTSRDWNGVLTQIIAWAGGIGGIMVAAHTQFAPAISFGAIKLAKSDIQTQVFLGLIATSLLSTLNEVKKAVDNGDDAKTQPLFFRLSQSAKAKEAARVAPPRV